MAIGNIIYSTSSTTITAGGVIGASNFERSTNLQVDTTTGNLNIAGSVNATGGIVASGTSNLGSVGSVKISGGSNGQVLSTDGSSNLSWATISIPSRVEVFTSTDTWTAPAGVSKILFRAIGGGGGGGKWQFSNFTGGGGGGYIEAYITVTPGTTYEIFIGSGGTGATTLNTNGGAGGSTGIKVLGSGSFICQAGGSAGSTGGGSVNNSANPLFVSPGEDGRGAVTTGSGKTLSTIAGGGGGVNQIMMTPYYNDNDPFQNYRNGFYGQGGYNNGYNQNSINGAGFGAGGASAWTNGGSNGSEGSSGIAFLQY